MWPGRGYRLAYVLYSDSPVVKPYSIQFLGDSMCTISECAWRDPEERHQSDPSVYAYPCQTGSILWARTCRLPQRSSTVSGYICTYHTFFLFLYIFFDMSDTNIKKNNYTLLPRYFCYNFSKFGYKCTRKKLGTHNALQQNVAKFWSICVHRGTSGYIKYYMVVF